MGKKQHSKDKMYLLQSEWQYEGGGYRNKGGAAAKLPFRRLPFQCCALSLAPFQDPMMTPTGVVYDMLNIVPYISKNKKCPVTGVPLTLKDLTKLIWHKSDKDEYHCPIMFKSFTAHTRIVAIKTSGNVYCWEAIENLCYKTKNMKDLLTDEPFKKTDVITLQDPHNFENREIENFNYVKTGEDTKVAKVAQMTVNDETRRILEKAGLSTPGQKGSVLQSNASQLEAQEKDRKAREAANAMIDASQRKKGVSSNMMAASFTSTAVEVHTRIEEQRMSDKEIKQERWGIMRTLAKKGYVQMKTTHGDLNLEIRADFVPATAENFLTLCAKNFYKDTKFHRSIKNFMIQGGDPTGTGKGGESCWGGKFDDEFDSRLKHSGRGLLSMANSGLNTNGSQFFITFKSCGHLDNKHSVFGSVVGGLDILARLEAIETDSTDTPTQEIKILETIVFVNPFETDLKQYLDEKTEKEEAEKKEAERKRKREAEDKEGHTGWYSNPAGAAASKATVYKSGVGKYIATELSAAGKSAEVDGAVGGAGKGKAVAAIAAAPAAPSSAAVDEEEDMWANVVPVKKAKLQPKAGFGDFAGW
mmetsp:Transcript_59351/g.87020  ORF Transcript_59351/g.87020 Transcript_59351/m.87020 type:complete len:586 (-) Transcript_59351:44-1801(-)|eukprot:CAMPEP_0179464906 /NCGR_PEP_ID=MMETSP0799-20121207/46610_1 /TAXON_ID=46947 /ORGANISM="Geminigera cryophila, Strain CCMP2564" /LENGTH=585 /DNA_ID=CAMNT_0021268933 /DNA_START=62 /DNA_END=1819 /DNA_ORIENTATION=-